MTYWKHILIWKLCIKMIVMSWFLATQPYALAQAVSSSDAAYWNMNRAISGVTQDALRNRGYVANDPRTYSTLQGMSNTGRAVALGAGTLASLTVGVVTAPAWGSFLVAAAVQGAVFAVVGLAVGAIWNWLFRSDGKIDVGSGNAPYATCSLGATFEYWDTVINGVTLTGCDGMSLALQALHIKAPPSQGQNTQTNCVNSVTVISCTNANGTGIAFRRTGTLSISCGPGTYHNGTGCQAYTYPPVPATAPASAQTLQQAVDAIPQADKTKPLNPQLVAATANSLWQQAAAQSGYAGIPYPASNPISTAEATRWQQTNPTAWPTVGDFVTPRPTGTATPSPWALPSNPTVSTTAPQLTTQPNPSVVNPSTQTLTNLGPDPATPAPELEAIPTAQDILNPVLNLLPNHKSYTAQAQAGQCPTPTITIYGTHTLNAHCTIIDQNKSIIQAAMTFAWAAIALFIILSA